MSDREFQILSFIRVQETPSWVDVLNAVPPPLESDAILQKLCNTGLVEKSGIYKDFSTVRLTTKGLGLFLEEADRREKAQLLLQQDIEQEQQRKAERHRIAEAQAARYAEERTSDRKFQIRLSFLQAALAFFAGALAANLDRLIPWLFRLFCG